MLGKEEARSLVGTQGQTRPLLGGVSPLSPAVREKFTSLAASITEIVRQVLPPFSFPRGPLPLFPCAHALADTYVHVHMRARSARA